MNRYYYIYQVINLLTDKQYVGSRMYDREIKGQAYMGSSKLLKVDISLFGIENFDKVKLEENILFVNSKETEERESYYIHHYNTLNPNGYNLHDPKGGWSTVGMRYKQKNPHGPMSKENKQGRIGKRKPYKIRSSEHCKNISIGRIGKKHPNVCKEKTCPYCGLVGKGSNMTRYHFDKCKLK